MWCGVGHWLRKGAWGCGLVGVVVQLLNDQWMPCVPLWLLLWLWWEGEGASVCGRGQWECGRWRLRDRVGGSRCRTWVEEVAWACDQGLAVWVRA